MHKHEQQLADTLLHLPLPHWEDCTERRNKDDLLTSLCDRGVRDELITDVSSDATHWPTNKPNEPEARIENMILRHDFWSRPLREQPPCKNLSIPTAPTLDLADYSTQKIQTHRSKQFEFYKLRMIRGNWKTTSSRSAETKRDIKQLAQHIAHTQSDELRCNHNTLMGLNWWTRCKANTPWRTCTCQFQLGHREDVSEGWTRNDLVTWLSEKGCWMKSSLTSELKQTNMKKTQSVRNMNKPWSWKVTQGEKLSEEQPQCETEGRHTISPRKRQTATHRHFMHNTLRPTLQIYSTFTAPSLTKKHVFPFVSQHDMNPLGGHAHSHTIQLTAPPSQHLIEQARTTTGRRSVALSTLTLRWCRREMRQIWFGHSALRQKVLDEPWPLWTNKKTSQRHDTSCNRPPQSRQNESKRSTRS